MEVVSLSNCVMELTCKHFDGVWEVEKFAEGGREREEVVFCAILMDQFCLVTYYNQNRQEDTNDIGSAVESANVSATDAFPNSF